MEPDVSTIAAQARARRVTRLAAKSIAQRFQDSLYNDVDTVCAEHGIKRPGGFLAELMAGVDPRATNSRARALVDAIEARGATALPTEEEWFELAEIIRDDPRYDKEPITLDLSYKAARDLLPVLYKQQHAVDAQAEVITIPSPLTPDEIEAFRIWFDEKY